VSAFAEEYLAVIGKSHKPTLGLCAFFLFIFSTVVGFGANAVVVFANKTQSDRQSPKATASILQDKFSAENEPQSEEKRIEGNEQTLGARANDQPQNLKSSTSPSDNGLQRAPAVNGSQQPSGSPQRWEPMFVPSIFTRQYLPLLFGIILVAFAVLYVIVPLVLRFKSPEYPEWIHKFSHGVFTGVAFTISGIIALIAIDEISVLNFVHATIQQQVTERDEPHLVFELAEVMFGFFGLVLAGVTAVGGVFAWWLRQKVLDATAKADEVKKEVDNTLARANYNFILSADIALMRMPEITFSQQIPMSLLKTLRTLHNVFDIQDREQQLWKALVDSQNGARIRYARALYLLGTASNEEMQSKKDTVTALTLLTDASNNIKSTDRALGRDILIRLFQAQRQGLKFEDAARTLETLKKRPGEDIQILCYLGKIILSLQQGLNCSDQKQRQLHFKIAMENANILVEVHLFRNGSYIGQELHGPSSLYYCAKAYWSYRFMFPKHLEANELPVSIELWNACRNNFDRVAAQANELFTKQMGKGIDDNLTSMIYQAANAYLVIARKQYPDTLDPEPGLMRETQQFLNSAPDQLRLVAEEAKLEFGDDSEVRVYNDHTECLDRVQSFEGYVGRLRTFLDDSDEIWNFYGGKEPTTANV
jgi:hypothetical protein